MKSRLLSFLAGLAAVLTLIGGLDLSGIISVLPAEVATGFATALPLLAALTHFVRAVGDQLDDGQRNGSFKAIAAFLILGAALALPSCVPLAGTSVSFDEHGNLVVSPPPRPIVIPIESAK